ncbi:DUF2000 domain-containing protein [Bacillus aquiflavi]|uniref:DUF2000 domain-containing protein n=1 Tax=Bacillus aquiflavi TaxID=2672567 RepID=A0A6B3VW34_9BACI|nr:DUF2000 domain-containing protein [Bacillus aquiflavi]MBA4538130.1 DUF2000 domain-containing protein [Bacillus aquiflavi]NEY82450.1 DUF2000 domain-containing protein [Bacillus aquiflavi]UAC48578.1 DUF2000 domain-containing protein [Bacillus aquiflavi]
METKCVMVIDANLPTGLIANTTAVLALTLGKEIDGIIGPDVKDGSGHSHIGITTTPIPILKGNSEKIKQLREKVYDEEFSDLLVVDFSNAAQTTKNYEEYTQKIAAFSATDLKYLGIALYGDKKKVNKLTGSIALLR